MRYLLLSVCPLRVNVLPHLVERLGLSEPDTEDETSEERCSFYHVSRCTSCIPVLELTLEVCGNEINDPVASSLDGRLVDDTLRGLGAEGTIVARG